jgi:lipopolysaccharide assembly outer membrane protein LptD (OstA)
VKTFFLLILILTLLGTTYGQQDESTPSSNSQKTFLESDKEVYLDQSIQKLVATPNARLQSGPILLTADRIEYDTNTSEALATGKVILTDGTLRILAETTRINLKTGDFNATKIKTMLYPLAIRSAEISRTENIIQGVDTSLFYLNEEENEPSLELEKVEINQIDNSIYANQVKLKLDDYVIGQLPSFRGKAEKNPFDYKISVGKQSNLGWYLGTGGKWSLSSTLDFSTDITAYTKRGWLFSPGLDWQLGKKTEEDFISGGLDSGWINDLDDNLGNDLRNISLENHRSYIRAYSKNRINKNLRIAAQVEWNSDSEVYRDFNRERFFENQFNDSFGEVSYDGENWTVSTLTRWQANEYESVIEQIPSIRFDLAPTPWIDSNLYHSLAFEFSGFREKGNTGKLIKKSNKLDLGYEIIRPFRFNNGLVFNPHFAYRRQDYSLTGKDAGRSFGEWGNEFRYHLSGDYEVKNKTWNIDQIRHVVGFSLSHRKVNRLESTREDLIPQIDTPFKQLNMSPIDLMDYMEADALEPYEVVRLGWENQLLTRNESEIRSLASINFFQDLYRTSESNPDSSKDFFTDLSLHPANWISVSGRSKINVETGEVIRSSLTAQIRDGFINTIELGYVKYLSFSNQWRFSGQHRWNDTKTIRGAIAYEEDTKELSFWQTSLEYKTSPSWSWIFSITGRDGTAKENETEFALSTRIFAF